MSESSAPRNEGASVSGKGNVQDVYLKQVSEQKTVVRISLVSGKEVRGQIKSFDAFTIIVTTKGLEILVYKSAIAAIGPATNQE
jgi:host factor-I protein